MGVKGLQTFLEKYSSEACYFVDISKLVNCHKMKTGKNAKIVVSAQSCYRMWHAEIDATVGYEVQALMNRLREFVASFKKLNVDLIFFFGGLSTEKKRETWLARRRSNIIDVHEAIDSLTRYGSLPDGYQPILPNPGLTMAFILKYVLGCEVRMAIGECDDEIIAYAQEHECFAIFGQDTDFVISQIDAIVLSSGKFNIKNMTTLLYDRVQLARKLRIHTEELPLLSILAGNDLIYADEIEGFQHRICPGRGPRIPYQVLMRAIASYINRLPKNEHIERTLARLAMDLFNDPSKVELLKTSYYSYFVRTVNRNSVSAPAVDEWSEILRTASDRYRNVLLPTLAYSVLSEQIFEGGTSLEDLRTNHSVNALTRDQPSATVLRPLRLRLYGILLSEKGCVDPSVPVTVQEWCNENEMSYEKPVVVEPVKPTVHHPGLMALWSDDDTINEVRWTLFLKTISPSLNAAQWQSFDEKLLLSTLSVYHLYDIKYLNDSELDAVLVTIATCPLYDAGKLSTLKYGTLDFRAANISITLNRTFGLVVTILAACGYPVKLSNNNALLKFEGKVFQIKYADVVKKRVGIKSLCENNEGCFKLFKRMKELILGTEDDQDIVCKLDEMKV